MEGIKEIFGIGITIGGASAVNTEPVTEQVVETPPVVDPTPDSGGGEVGGGAVVEPWEPGGSGSGEIV